VKANRILLPGRCRADLERLSAQFAVPFERGPEELKDIPAYFGKGGHPPDLSRYDVRIFAEIVDASALGVDVIRARALRMREAMRGIKHGDGDRDLLLKIGIHEGPCLAVTLNDRQDYFGQTVNIAARVQGLAASRSIFATEPVVDHPRSSSILATSGLKPLPKRASLRGIADEFMVYEIP